MGGKSRKSGGVSRKLIERIKQGQSIPLAPTKYTKKRETNEPVDEGLGLSPVSGKK